jgi:hypothetical protein
MDSSWAKAEKDRFSKMREWRETELAGINIEGRDLFYPFSGPDFVHAYSFFNKARNMYMFGLEGPGSLPNVEKRSQKEMGNYYLSVQHYLRDVMSKSYFITKRMLAGLYQVNGMTPIICVFLVRTGNTVMGIQAMKLDAQGKIVPYDTTGMSQKQKENYKVIRIDYLDAQTQQPKSIYYYSGDLQDLAIKENSPIYHYLNNMPLGCNGMLKSASYLLHGDNFSKARKAMLDRCAAILQDDTGVAYRFYEKDKWELTFYGVYVKPVGDFPWANQQDLAKAFKDTSKVKPLPFGIGYHWFNRKDNLILAKKKVNP